MATFWGVVALGLFVVITLSLTQPANISSESKFNASTRPTHSILHLLQESLVCGRS
ncbi:hypothetical protein DN34_2843 [Vibrio cholerae]|nr:hypothetical protein DN34_2843 [Vibrio cholerae]